MATEETDEEDFYLGVPGVGVPIEEFCLRPEVAAKMKGPGWSNSPLETVKELREQFKTYQKVKARFLHPEDLN